jgi:D-hydroxyproline dehydrogenase subunit gamma
LIKLTVNEIHVSVDEGTSVAAAVARAGSTTFRRSVNGEPRGPLCGMGTCFECRVTIDGIAHQRSCNVIAKDGMEIRTT